MEAIEITECAIGLMPSEDAWLTAERAVAHPDAGKDAAALLTTPGTLVRAVTRSLESTAQKDRRARCEALLALAVCYRGEVTE